MSKRTFRIIRLYIISLLFIVSYFYLENSTVIPKLVQAANKLRHKGFVTFILTGLLKYGLLLVGIGILIILSFLLIKEKNFKNRNK